MRSGLTRICRAAGLLGVLIVWAPQPAVAQTGENVLIVANNSSAPSIDIAEYYAAKRHVPSDQIVRVAVPVTEEVARATYEAQIELPLAQWLATHAAQDRILYIVLTKGLPLRVTGTSGATGTVASVDSELTLLYRKLSGQVTILNGSVKNPYFLGDSSISEAKPFTHRQQSLYLVTRLDGYTVADVKGLIDRGVTPSQEGRILLDERAELTSSLGNRWLEAAATALRKMPGWDDRVVLDTRPFPLRDESNVLGYYSWGSNDLLILARHLGLRFVPGALAAMFVSTDARTMEEPPETWEIHGREYAGSPQSLTGDLIRDGVTGVAGHVAEPYLNAAIRPDILFPAYLSGFNLVESFYLAMPAISWQTVVIGDPLCAPFRQHAVAAQDIDPGIDAETDLPVFLSAQRVGLLTKGGVKPDAAKLVVKSEVRFSKQDRVGGRETLEKATEIDQGFVAGHMTLASLYEGESQWALAIDRYRRVLAIQPNHVVALNNLAYGLAEHQNAAAEALPLAQRANEIGKKAPVIADTLAWVYHRLNRDAEAEPLVTVALQGLPKNADIHLHAAVILAAVGKADAAAKELQTALTLNKSLEQQDEVRRLRERLKARK